MRSVRSSFALLPKRRRESFEPNPAILVSLHTDLHPRELFSDEERLLVPSWGTIAGAGSGIGQGAAIRFAGSGCILALAGRNAERLYHTADMCCKAGASPDKILLLPGDVTNEESVKCIIHKSLDRFRRLDILINNAGVSMQDDIEHTSLEHFDTIMNTNVRGPFYMTMLATPHLVRTRGVIINISSVAAMQPVRDLLTYGMSKAAMDHFTKTLALELGPKGVRVNAINVGEIREGSSTTCNDYEQCNGYSSPPLRRTGTTEDVVNSIVFLCTAGSGFITGVTLPVDGGAHCGYIDSPSGENT